MIYIVNINAQKFSLNGIPYFKNFSPVVFDGSESLKIVNTYDSRFELVPYTSYTEFEVGGVSYGSVAELQEALLPVLFTRATLGAGGGGSQDLQDVTGLGAQTDLSMIIRNDALDRFFAVAKGSKDLGMFADRLSHTSNGESSTQMVFAPTLAGAEVSIRNLSGTMALLSDISAVLEGIAWKQPVELLFDTAVTQSGAIPQLASLTNQGITLVNDSRIILSAQANPIYNGIWRVNSTPVSGFYRLYRTDDANTTAELNNAVVGVTGGTHIGKTFRQSTLNPVIGTSDIVFQDFGSAVANATNLISGITKLYNNLGSNEDGTINQKIISDNFALKFNSADICIKSLNTDVTMSSNVQLNTNLTFPIGSNENWVIEFVMSGGCTSSGGTRFQVNTPAGSTGSGHVTASAAQQGISVNSPALAIATGSASQTIRIYMTIRNGATAGNVTLSFASNSNGQTSILRANSYFIATKTTLV